MVQQPYPSVAKAPSPAAWAYPAQVPTDRDQIRDFEDLIDPDLKFFPKKCLVLC